MPRLCNCEPMSMGEEAISEAASIPLLHREIVSTRTRISINGIKYLEHTVEITDDYECVVGKEKQYETICPFKPQK